MVNFFQIFSAGVLGTLIDSKSPDIFPKIPVLTIKKLTGVNYKDDIIIFILFLEFNVVF